jgi:replicative DNA helicase
MLSSAWRQTGLGHSPYIAEMEMRDTGLATRLACGECGIPVWKAKRKLLEEMDLHRLASWHVTNGERLGRMLINETPSMNTASLAARLDRAKRKNAVDVVWIDYIGLMQPVEKQKDAYHRMSRISNELRVLAKEMDLPFIVLAQLSRPVKGTTVAPPKLTDLRDSGEIEQDAEAVAFLHRPAYYDPAEDQRVEFIVAKNRDGQDGKEDLWFDGPGVRIMDKGVPSFNVALPDAVAPF